MKVKEITKENATAGATCAGAIAATPQGGAGPQVGSLFGGSYKQSKGKKKKKNDPSIYEEKETYTQYIVKVLANIYSGKYYDQGYAQVKVPVEIQSEDEAIQWVKNNKKEVIDQLSKKRIKGDVFVSQGGRPYVRSPVEKNVFFNHIGRVFTIRGKKQLSEYWARGTVNGKKFLITTPDVYDAAIILHQNPKLSDMEAAAIEEYTNDDDLLDINWSKPAEFGGYMVKITAHGGHAEDESTSDDDFYENKKSLNEYDDEEIIINGKEVDKDSIEIGQVHYEDNPKFLDVGVEVARFVDGRSLSLAEISELSDNYSDLIEDLVSEFLDDNPYISENIYAHGKPAKGRSYNPEWLKIKTYMDKIFFHLDDNEIEDAKKVASNLINANIKSRQLKQLSNLIVSNINDGKYQMVKNTIQRKFGLSEAVTEDEFEENKKPKRTNINKDTRKVKPRDPAAAALNQNKNAFGRGGAQTDKKKEMKKQGPKVDLDEGPEIPKEQDTYEKLKEFSVTALAGYARRIGMPNDVVRPLVRQHDQDGLIDEIMGFLHGEDWERTLMTVGVLESTVLVIK